MEQVAFFAGAIGALGGAIAVIALRNPFYSVLALVVHLFSLAGLFLLLHAEFVAAAQIVVYAGAIMVLYVFVAAYVGGFEEPLWDAIPAQRMLAPLLAGALFIELSIAILGTGLSSLGSEGPTIPFGFGSPEAIGKLMLERFLIPFEGASLLLLIAAVGAVVLAARRPALDPASPGGSEGDERVDRISGSPEGGEPTAHDIPPSQTASQRWDEKAREGAAADHGPTPSTRPPVPAGSDPREGGAGEGPADTQVAGPEEVGTGGRPPARRTEAGPLPAAPAPPGEPR